MLKIGRTQLQDAVPMTLGQEFSTFAVMIGEDEQRLREARALIARDQPRRHRDRHRHQRPTRATPGWSSRNLAGADRDRRSCRRPNLVEATQDTGAFVQVSGVLKRVAAKLSKTCNDLRLLSSGPQAGLRRDQAARAPGRLVDHAGQGQPGDPGSDEPGRVRGDRQRHHRHDRLARRGQLQLNAFEPIIAHSLFKSLTHLREACLTLARNCVERDHLQPRAARRARPRIGRARHRAQSLHRLRERHARRARSARDRPPGRRPRARDGADEEGGARRGAATRGAHLAAVSRRRGAAGALSGRPPVWATSARSRRARGLARGEGFRAWGQRATTFSIAPASFTLRADRPPASCGTPVSLLR